VTRNIGPAAPRRCPLPRLPAARRHAGRDRRAPRLLPRATAAAARRDCRARRRARRPLPASRERGALSLPDGAAD
jgi:hypothetical protein